VIVVTRDGVKEKKHFATIHSDGLDQSGFGPKEKN
jgi:hypothetical protein